MKIRKRAYRLALLPLLALLAVLTGCDKVPMNGELDGMWQLVQIEADGVTQEVKDEKLYLSFQLHLAQFTRSNPQQLGRTNYYAHFEHKGNILRIYDLFKAADYETAQDYNNRITEENISELHPWGFYDLDTPFHVVKLTGSSMILRSDKAQLEFRKF